MRQSFTGRLNVYRESSQVERLSANVVMDNGVKFYYHPCPKCFREVVTDGLRNVKQVTFSADQDGKNPRNVTVLE